MSFKSEIRKIDAASPANGHSYLPRGCDQQGRYPQAAHEASEWADEDESHDEFGIWRGLALAITVTVALLCFTAVLAGLMS